MTEERAKDAARTPSLRRWQEEDAAKEPRIHEGKPRKRESQGGETSNEQSGRAGGPGPE